MSDQIEVHSNTAVAQELLTSLGSDRQFFFDNMTDDIRLEFPYAASVGMPTLVQGRENALAYIRGLFAMVEGLTFREPSAEQMSDPDRVLCTYKGLSAPEGRPVYDQTYITIMQFRDGRITHFTEYWDTTIVNQALGDLISGAQ